MHFCSEYLTIGHTFADVRIQVRQLSDQQAARTPLSKKKTAEDTIVAKALDRQQRTYRGIPEASKTKLQWKGGVRRIPTRE